MKKIIIVLLLILLTGCTKNTYLDNYKHMSKEDYNMQYNLNDSNNVFVSISYNEFINMMNSKETFIFYFGGSWCKNCYPITPFINQVVKEYNLSVYNLDPRNNNKEAIDDFRKCNNKEQEDLYRNFINTLGYENEETVWVDIDIFGNRRDTGIASLSVPSIFAIKNGKIEYSVIEEYTEEDLNEEVISYFKQEITKLVNKL